MKPIHRDTLSGRFNLLAQLLKKKLGFLAAISLGIFLFVLFFQPFPLERFDFNNRLLFVAGFGAITFFFMLIEITARQFITKKDPRDSNENTISSFLHRFIILALCSVSLAFYLRYVGSVSISFFLMFKIVLICLAPPVILNLIDINQGLKENNKSLVAERRMIQKQIEKFEEDNLNKSLEFISENSNENITLLIAEVIFIQSADNYVEISYLNDGIIKKKLIRNTLKNIESQIKKYSNFIRCHRTCIVNMHYIERLEHNYSSYWLKLKVYQEKIPVSRQYLLKLKEAL